MEWINILPSLGFLLLAIMISGRIIFLKNNGIQVSTKNDNAWGKTLVYLIFLPILLCWIFEVTKPVLQFSFSLLPETLTKPLISLDWLKALGVILIVLAIILMAFTLLHFKTSIRFGLDEKNLGKMITTGVFSISRNPFFVSLELYFIGIAVQIPSLFFIGFALLSAVSMHLFVLKEEKFLKENYGEEYRKYTTRVRRYF